MASYYHEPYFNFKFSDDELKDDFLKIIDDNYTELFSDVETMGANYSVSWIDAKSFVNNEDGNFRQTFNSVLNQMNTTETLNESRSSIRTVATIHKTSSNNFRGLLAKMNELIKDLEMSRIKEQQTKNPRTDLWNIVWYAKYQYV